jgi:hypothetical protein
MDRIDGAGHVDHMFVVEDVATSRPPTEITAEWLNGVQEENLGVIEGSGQTPDGADNLQVFKGIKIISRGNLGAVSAAGGTADAITAVYDPAITELINGMTLYVRAASANATTTPTFTPNSGSIAAKPLVKGAGAALSIGDIAGSGHWLKFQYDAALDKWVLLNPAKGVTSGLGVDQTWQSVIGSRALATTYTNTTGKAIFVSASAFHSSTASGSIQFTVNGILTAANSSSAVNTISSCCFIVPPGGTYSVTWSVAGATLSAWNELR